jgi:hypothetical protein
MSYLRFLLSLLGEFDVRASNTMHPNIQNSLLPILNY